MNHGVPIHVRSSFSDAQGTWVTKEDTVLENIVVSGVAFDKTESRVHLVGVEDKPGVVAKIFGTIAAQNISVDMIIQSVSIAPSDGVPRTDLTFTVTTVDLARAKPLIEGVAREVGGREVRYDEDVVKVSIVGLGMRSHAGVAAKMFAILAQEGINIQAISTSEIKISCLVASKYTELAVRALHDGFELSKVRASVPPKG
jgi:aspartate kinase